MWILWIWLTLRLAASVDPEDLEVILAHGFWSFLRASASLNGM
jgi:hypothetical protein